VDGVTATIEYAIEVLKAALDQESLERMPKARSWRR
jgi:hypothetical protein